jgi:hypothetical protein
MNDQTIRYLGGMAALSGLGISAMLIDHDYQDCESSQHPEPCLLPWSVHGKRYNDTVRRGHGRTDRTWYLLYGHRW